MNRRFVETKHEHTVAKFLPIKRGRYDVLEIFLVHMFSMFFWAKFIIARVMKIIVVFSVWESK